MGAGSGVPARHLGLHQCLRTEACPNLGGHSPPPYTPLPSPLHTTPFLPTHTYTHHLHSGLPGQSVLGGAPSLLPWRHHLAKGLWLLDTSEPTHWSTGEGIVWPWQQLLALPGLGVSYGLHTCGAAASPGGKRHTQQGAAATPAGISVSFPGLSAAFI